MVVTQAVHQAPELGALLADCGAVPLFYPCIAIEPPADTTELDAALAAAAAGYYDWLVITSANTVLVLAEPVAAAGDRRATHWQVYAWRPSARPRPKRWRSILAAAPTWCPTTARRKGWRRRSTAVTERGPAHARAAGRHCAAGAGAGAHGGRAGRAPRWRRIARRWAAAACRWPHCWQQEPAGSEGVDAITFTSPSTVRNLLARLEQEGSAPWICSILQHVVLACIGPVTADALHAAGLPPAVVATKQSLEGLVEALSDLLSGPKMNATIVKDTGKSPQVQYPAQGAAFPAMRPRRMRISSTLRRMVRENDAVAGRLYLPAVCAPRPRPACADRVDAGAVPVQRGPAGGRGQGASRRWGFRP